MLTGFVGGFFLLAAANAGRKRTKQRERRTPKDRKRLAIARALCGSYVPKSITPKRDARRYCYRRFPWVSKISRSPKRAAWDSICVRSPARTICRLAESRYFRAVASNSSEVTARTLARYVSR